MELLKTYTSSITGYEVLYSPKESFPPGSGTATIAEYAAYDLRMLRYVSGNLQLPVLAIELGVGSGIYATELYAHLNSKSGVTFKGVDIEPTNVMLTCLNLARMAQRHNFELNANIEVGDWTDDLIWKGFKSNSCHSAYFNPPFYSPGTELPKKLITAPHRAMFAPDLDGLYHYHVVLPRLAKILSHQSGSAIIFRLPDYIEEKHITNNGKHPIGEVINKVLGEIPVQCNIFYYNFDSPTAKKRFCKIQIPIIDY